MCSHPILLIVSIHFKEYLLSKKKIKALNCKPWNCQFLLQLLEQWSKWWKGWLCFQLNQVWTWGGPIAPKGRHPWILYYLKNKFLLQLINIPPSLMVQCIVVVILICNLLNMYFCKMGGIKSYEKIMFTINSYHMLAAC